jgi:hypothetical protein
MTEMHLRNQIGVLLIASNMLVVASTIVLFFLNGFLYNEMTTTIALVVPMFSVYTTAIIKSIIANRTNTKDETSIVSPQYVLISWVLPSIFTIYLVVIVFLKAFNVGFASFEQFKGLLVASETIFGTYVGLIVGSMFEIGKGKEKSSLPKRT